MPAIDGAGPAATGGVGNAVGGGGRGSWNARAVFAAASTEAEEREKTEDDGSDEEAVAHGAMSFLTTKRNLAVKP